jgi:hypothetical protein
MIRALKMKTVERVELSTLRIDSVFARGHCYTKRAKPEQTRVLRGLTT